MDGYTNTDDFSEKFQTAFDIPPHFWKILLQISFNFILKKPCLKVQKIWNIKFWKFRKFWKWPPPLSNFPKNSSILVWPSVPMRLTCYYEWMAKRNESTSELLWRGCYYHFCYHHWDSFYLYHNCHCHWYFYLYHSLSCYHCYLVVVPQSSTAAPVEEAAQALRVKRCAFWNFYKTVFYHFWSAPSYFCFFSILWFRIFLFLVYGFCMEFFESLSLPSANSALMLIALKQLFRLLWLFWLFFPQHEYSFINMFIFSPTWLFLHRQAGWRRHPKRLRSKHCHRRIPSLPTVQVRFCHFLFSPWFPIIPNIFTLSPQGNFPMIFQNPKSFQFSLYLLKGNLCWERVWRSWRLWEVKCRKELRNIRDSISNIDFYLCASRFV